MNKDVTFLAAKIKSFLKSNDIFENRFKTAETEIEDIEPLKKLKSKENKKLNYTVQQKKLSFLQNRKCWHMVMSAKYGTKNIFVV